MSTGLILSLVAAVWIATGFVAWCILRVGSGADRDAGGQQ